MLSQSEESRRSRLVSYAEWQAAACIVYLGGSDGGGGAWGLSIVLAGRLSIVVDGNATPDPV